MQQRSARAEAVAGSEGRALLRTAYHADAYPGMGSGGLAADAYAGAADWDEEIWFFPAFNL